MQILVKINKKLNKNSYLYWAIREFYTILVIKFLSTFDFKKKKLDKKNILFYHINSLSYGGTEKQLQIFAKYLNKDKYNVYFMYPESFCKTEGGMARLKYLIDSNVICLPFGYMGVGKYPPYYVNGMNPRIQYIIKTLDIDILFTSDAGAAGFPFSNIKNIPIFFANIFGQPNIQKNIKYHMCLSEEVLNKIKHIVKKEKLVVFPIPLEKTKLDIKSLGENLRAKIGVSPESMLFGRIGRPDDNIFDPIGIDAFEIVVKKDPSAHYLIMAPMPKIVQIVKDRNIPNVHFLEPSSKEEDVWAFHGAIDVLAHFRNDGETFGLNIAESMLAGKPILSHKSHIYNAHLEYLEPSFSLVAELDDVNQYAENMQKMVLSKKEGSIKSMGEIAKEKAEKLFLINNVIKEIEDLIDNV